MSSLWYNKYYQLQDRGKGGCKAEGMIKYSINDLLDYLNNLSDRDDLNTDKDQSKLTIIKDMLIELCRIKFNNDFNNAKDLYKR